MASNNRYYQLDLLRFIAALSVLFYHYCFRGHAADELSDLAFAEWAHLAKYGYLGVDLFFMISGFVILMSAEKVDVRGFIRSRVCRLYPAFWLCVTLSALTMWALGDARYPITWSQYLLNLSMVSGFWQVPFVDGVYWTLLIEIKFYALIALLLASGQLKQIRYYLLGWLMLTLLGPKLALPDWLLALLFIEWSPYFIAGATLYLIHRQGFKLIELLLLTGSYIMALRNAGWRTPNQEIYFQTEISTAIVIVLITLCFLCMTLLAMNKLNWLNRPGLLRVGMLTYPLYLLHENIGFILFNTFANAFNRYLLLAMTVTLLVLISWLIARWAEPKGAKALKHLFDKAWGVDQATPQTSPYRQT